MAVTTNPREHTPFIEPRTTPEPRKSRKGLFLAIGGGVVAIVTAGALFIGARGGNDADVPERSTSPGAGAPVAGGGDIKGGGLPGTEGQLRGQELLGEGFPDLVVPSSADPQELLEQLHINYHNSLMFAPNVEQSAVYADYFWLEGGLNSVDDDLYTLPTDGYRDYMAHHPETTVTASIEVLDHNFDTKRPTEIRQVLAEVKRTVSNNFETTETDSIILFEVGRRVNFLVEENGDSTGQQVEGWYVVSKTQAQPGQTSLAEN